MSVQGPPFVVSPNEVRARGDEEFEAVAVSLRVDREGITVETRTGTLSGQGIELAYDDLTAVDTDRELSYALVLRTGATEYVVTNVTPSEDDITRIVEFIRRQMRGGPASTSGSRGTAAADGNGGPGSLGAAEELEKLADLNERGIISDEEFERKKDELL